MRILLSAKLVFLSLSESLGIRIPLLFEVISKTDAPLGVVVLIPTCALRETNPIKVARINTFFIFFNFCVSHNCWFVNDVKYHINIV